jgi:hypothetical protein
METKTAPEGASRNALAEQLRKWGVRGVLVQIADRGQIIELRCEMPDCYCPKGRGHFDPKAIPPPDWAPSPDHYPKLKAHGGQLRPDNVRLAHVLCNRVNYGWRVKINPMLAKRLSLEEIAERLNRQGVPRPHGRSTWTAALVRKVFVS